MKNLVKDLTWIEMLKGMAIIGVFFDHWMSFTIMKPDPALLSSLLSTIPWGSFVHIFVILSGFGLTMSYYHGKKTWSWKKWAWRRIVKIIVPYQLATILTFLLGVLGSYIYQSVDIQFTWKAFFSYCTFTRNFYSPAWRWNEALWFMPIIVGLYFIFPFLIFLMNRYGPLFLLIFSFIVTYVTITVAILAGFYRGHQGDLFTFYIVQFSLGMLLAHFRIVNPNIMSKLFGLKALFLGMIFYLLSFSMVIFFHFGTAYNDLFTSIGIFLILLNAALIIRKYTPVAEKVLVSLGKESYLMFLIHLPILLYLVGPLFRVPTNPILVLPFGALYFFAIYYLCSFLILPINSISSWMFSLFYPPYNRLTD